jgi:hypothetical protein
MNNWNGKYIATCKKGVIFEAPKYSKAFDFWYSSQEEYFNHPNYLQQGRDNAKESRKRFKENPELRYSKKYDFWFSSAKEYHAHPSQKARHHKKDGYLLQIWSLYRIREEHFMKMWEEQNGLCLGCNMKLVSSVCQEEREQYDNNPNLKINIDYSLAVCDHDKSMKKPKEFDPNYVRGLLCRSCNHFSKDVLNPTSKWYVLGEDGHKNKNMLIMEREMGFRSGWEKE